MAAHPASRSVSLPLLPSPAIPAKAVSCILLRLETESNKPYSRIMKTTVEIPDEEFRDLVRFTKAKTKRDAIVTAIADFNQRRRMAALVKHSGTFRSLATNEELEASEASEPHTRGAS